MTADEANAFVRQMQQTAEPAPEMELTIENWDREFGENGTVETPIGIVKMGENQFAKLSRQGRNGKLGMIKPTLTNPDIIIEDASKAAPGQQTERPSSYVFVKTFSGENGERIYHFTSITVSRDGQEVVISNQEKSASRIENLLKTGKTTWLNTTQKQENQRSVSETQNGESVPLSDSRIATYADNNSTPLGIHSPSDFHFKDTNPGPNAQETRTIDLNTLAGQTVTLVDGSQAYINQVYTNRNGFVEIDAVPIDPSTGQLLTNENGEEAHTLLDVRSIVTPKQQQQAQTQGNTQEATPAVPEQSPTQERQVTEQPAPSETEQNVAANGHSDAEQAAQTELAETAQAQSSPTAQEGPTSQIGRSLTADEAEALIQTMQAQAIPAPELELTPENWTAEFGENGEVETPVGTVKMGENQLAKMFMKGRSAQLGMVKPTLTTPDAIVEVESEASNGQTERPSSLLFIKTFLDKSGKKHTYFTSVTVRRDGMEVTISNHIEGEKRIRKFLEKGKLLYRIYGGAQTEQNRASVSGTTPPVNPGDLNKSTTFGPNAQEATQNIPRKKDGTPDYDQIEDPATVASALNEEFGEEAAEVARESLDEAREALEQADNIRKAIDRRRAQIKAQNEVTKWEEVCDVLAPTRETGTTEQAAETQDVPDVTLDPVMGDLITEEMHRRAPGTITVREQSDPKANNNFIQRYDIDGQPSGVYGIYDIEANINTEPVSFGLDEFLWRAENWDELEAMYDAYKADRPEVRSWIDDEGGAQFRDINDALEFKRFVDTQKNSKTADPVREAATPTEKLRAVGGIVAEMNRASGAAAYVFNDVTELPEGLRSQLEEGFERDGITWRRESYICAPQMQDAEQTRRTYIHEVSGHQNVEHAILKMADRTALWEAIVDDIGLDGLRAWGISELTEEITAYEAGEMEKRQLGREALAYATELNADLPYFMREKPLSLTIDLNQRITPETLRAILETANRYDDQRPRIEITNPGREGLLQNIDGVTRPAGGRIRAGNNSRSENTDNHISGNESTDPRGGDAPGSSFSTSRENDSRTVSGQDNARADRAESGALPAGETVDPSFAEKNDTEAGQIRFRQAFHGSPYDFERFDHTFMGTGEGAQAFGWGTYVTEVNGIARSYAEKLSGKNYVTDINRLALQIQSKKNHIKSRKNDIRRNEDYEKYARVIRKNLHNSQKEYKAAERAGDEKEMKFYQSLIDISNQQLDPEHHKRLIESFWNDINNAQADIDQANADITELKKKLKKTEGNRHLYTVEIPDNTGTNYLKWNESLKDVVDKKVFAQELLTEVSKDLEDETEIKIAEQDIRENLNDVETGKELYEAVCFYIGNEDASKFLSSLGFAGIEYPAQYTTGGRTDGARNYVIFNDADVKITDHVRFRNMAEAKEALLSPEEVNTRFNDELRQQIDGKLPKGHVYRLGRPGNALLSAGIPDLPIELSATRLAEKAAQRNHEFALSDVSGLPEALRTPIAIFAYGDKNKAQNIIVELEKDGKKFVVGLHLNQTRNEIEINSIRGLFPKTNSEWLNWIAQGKLLYADKGKIQALIDKQRTNLADVEYLDLDSVTNIIKNFANPTLREGEKASAAQNLADALGVPVRVVRSADEISGEESRFREKRGATGWHDPATGEIAVVLPNCADAAEVQQTILHEAVGHYGIPQLLGRERADELYRRVFDAVRDTRRGRELLDEHGSETVAGDEYLAEMAEGNVSPGVFRRMLAAVRAFFRDALGIDLKLTDADMRYLLWRSRHNLERARTVGEAMETIEQDIRLRAQTAHESARERKAERIDKLRRSEPLVFSGDEYKGKYELTPQSATRYMLDNIRGEYVNVDTGEKIQISRKGAEKVTGHDLDQDVHLQSVAYIPQMLEKAIFIDEMPNTKSSTGFDSYRYYVYGLKIGGVDYTAKLAIGVKKGQTYYDHSLSQIEKGNLLNDIDPLREGFAEKKIPNPEISGIKDKRLISVLQAEPLAYQQEAAKNEPKTVMEHLDRLTDETIEAAETRFRKKREPKPDDPIRTTKENLATRMGRKLQDAHIPVRQLQDYVREHGGTTDIDTDVYSALNRAFGRQTERMRRTDEKFRRIEKRVNEIHRKWGFGYKATEEYLAAKSSQERHASGIAAYAETTEAPWNRLHVEETIARFESVVPKEKIEALWRDIREMTQHQLDVMKNCDLITIQTYRDIQARGWQYYLPLQGLDFEFEDMADPHKLFDDALTTGRGTGAGALLQKARGRTTKPGDVLATLQRNVHLTIMAGEQNLAKLFLLRLAEQNPQLQGDTRTGKTTADDVAAMTATNDRFNEELETLTPENADATILWLGSPSAVLLSAGIEKKPIKLHGNKVFKKMKKHGFALEELRNLPEAVADPIAVFRNKDRKGNRSILTELKTENGNFLVTIDLGSGPDANLNIVSSVFGKADDSVLNWIEQGLATYINKEKALAFLDNHPAPIAGNAANAELSPATNIIKNFTNPTRPETKKRRAGIFEIEEQWFVRRDDSRITEAERERGEIYEKTLRRPPQEEIERSEAARREMKQAEQELRAVEKELRSIDPLDGDNDRLAELQDRRIELERRMDEAFGRITVLRTPPPKHAYTGLSKSEEARFEVPVYRHGVRTVVRLSDANAARAINGDFENLFGGAAEEIVRRIGSATRTMAGLNTSWNPEFMLKNKVRDSAWAFFYNWLDKEGSARGYLRNQGAAHAAIYRYHTNGARPLTMNERAGYDLYSTEGRQRAVERYGAARVRDALYDDFLMEGGLTGYAYMQDMDHYSRKLKKRARRAGNSVMQAFNAAATGFDLLNDLSEVSTRFATFLAQVERGSDVRSAVNYARDVTINFNRRGEWGRDLNALYMFYNASLQGVANLYQLGRRNKTRMGFAMAAVAGLGYGLSFLLNLWLSAMADEAGDDDEWRVSDYRRFTNICLPGWLVGSTERVVTIPLPQELRPAWVLGTVMADVTQGRLRADEGWGTAAAIFNSVTDAAGESFLPVEVDSKHPLKTFVPSVFKPLYEIGVNANFMDRKIYREAYPGQTVPESQLGMRNTFIAYKTVCEWLNEQGGGSTTVPAGMNEKGEINRWLNLLDVNPSKAEHLLSSYAGGAGRLIGRTWRCIAEPGDERRASDIPFINAFMADVEREENPNTRYYDTKEKLEMLNEVYRRSEREGGFPAYYGSAEEARAAQTRNKHWLLELRKTDGRIKKLTRERNETEQDSPEYKALTLQMNRLRSDFLLRYDRGAPNETEKE